MSDQKADKLLKDITALSHLIDRNNLALGNLFLKAVETQSYTAWGYPTFFEWLEASDLGISEHSANFLLSLARRLTALGVDTVAARGISNSKLNLIATLLSTRAVL